MTPDARKTSLHYHQLKAQLKNQTDELTNKKRETQKEVFKVMKFKWEDLAEQDGKSARKFLTTKFKEENKELITEFHKLAKANNKNETIFQEIFNKAKEAGWTDLDADAFRMAIAWEEKKQLWTASFETNETEIKKEDQKEKTQEHKEILKPEDISVYIHGNPLWHIVVGEEKDYRNDDLLKLRYFQNYYNGSKNKHIFTKHIRSWSTEYTFTIPSIENPQPGWWRSWGYVWISVILKNWHKIKGTWEIPLSRWIDYTNWNSLINEVMQKISTILFDKGLIKEVKWWIQWQIDDNQGNYIRSVVFEIKQFCLNWFNDPEWNLLEEKNP